jgi:hypothetical protein
MKKLPICQVKKLCEKLSRRLDQIEDRISGLDEEADVL